MNYRFKISFSALLALLFVVSCEEPIDWDLETSSEKKLVVEAVLTNIDEIQEIRLSQNFQELNDSVTRINNAVIKVEANQQVYDFTAVEAEPGLFRSDIPFGVIADLEYNLQIENDGKVYNASSNLSTVSPIPLIRFKRVGHPDSLTFADFAPLYNANQQAMYEMDVDWSHIYPEGLNKAKMYFYTFNSIDVSEFIPARRETVVFPRGSIVRVRKFGLNDDYAEYLRALAIETSWNGGFFNTTSANLPTNISNEALGFFSTCAILQDFLIAQ